MLLAHHLASPPLHDEEVGAEDGGVVAEEIGARRPVELAPEVRQHLVLALHVVGTRGDLAHGRPAKHQLVIAQPQQVRQVGRAVRELEHRQGAVGDRQYVGESRAHPGLEGQPVQSLTRADRRDLGRRGSGSRRAGQGTPPSIARTDPVVKLDALDAK